MTVVFEATNGGSPDDVAAQELAEVGHLYDRYLDLAELARLPTPVELGTEPQWTVVPTGPESPVGMLPTTDHPLGVVLPAAG